MNDIETRIITLTTAQDVSAFQVVRTLIAGGVPGTDVRRVLSRLLYTKRLVYVAPYIIKPAR